MRTVRSNQQTQADRLWAGARVLLKFADRVDQEAKNEDGRAPQPASTRDTTAARTTA